MTADSEADGGDRAPAGKPALRLLRIASFTSSFDRLTIAAMLAVIAADLGSSVHAVAQAAAAYFLCYGVAQLGWAAVSDRLGRVRTMRLSLLLAAVGGFTSTIATGPEWLIVARGFTGACFGATIPSALVYIGDTVPARLRQAPMADLMTSTALGVTVATVGAGTLADLLHWRAAFALPSIVAAVVFVLMRRLPEPERIAEPSPIGTSLRAVLGNRWALLVLALALTEGFVLLGPLTFLPVTLQADGLSLTISGLLTACHGAAVLTFSRVVKRRSRVTAPAWLIRTGGSVTVAAYLLLTVNHGVASVIVGSLLLGAGWAYMHSTMQTWATDVAPDARATAVSLFATMLFSGSALGTAVSGPLVDQGRFALVFALALTMAVPLVVVATLSRHRYGIRRQEAR